jgi:hypothetical protein
LAGVTAPQALLQPSQPMWPRVVALMLAVLLPRLLSPPSMQLVEAVVAPQGLVKPLVAPLVAA